MILVALEYGNWVSFTSMEPLSYLGCLTLIYIEASKLSMKNIKIHSFITFTQTFSTTHSAHTRLSC